MKDFNEYLKGEKERGGEESNLDIEKLVSMLAGRFDGKNQTELIKAVYQEARRGKERGTLTNRDIDGFVSTLSPMLDEKKRKLLKKIAEELKKI